MSRVLFNFPKESRHESKHEKDMEQALFGRDMQAL